MRLLWPAGSIQMICRSGPKQKHALKCRVALHGFSRSDGLDRFASMSSSPLQLVNDDATHPRIVELFVRLPLIEVAR